ncbi:MAG: hypothetical protein COX65_04340 [Elusimicrobia bacterium CG_4_10_14_0_2_um_filter_56_8]|nr:MAG: hypothetical protein COX65_04340 [Elusimicrobia bacterium CG_4_10_14_0_2_um_filter_56_8]
MKIKLIALSTLMSLASAAGAQDLAARLPAIDAGTILNQINNSQPPFPQPALATLDTCVFTDFKNNKCYFKCQSGAILTEPAVRPDFSSGEPAGACATHIIRPVAAGAFRTRDLDWAKQVAKELRKELKGYGIFASVIVVAKPGKKAFLAVEFKSWADYEQVKDLFYQDPGKNPSYMDIRVSPRVPKEAGSAPDQDIAAAKSAGDYSLVQRDLLLTRMTSNTLKTIALTLRGLDQLNSPDAAPAAYSEGVQETSADIEEAVTEMELGLRARDGLMLRQEVSRMEPMVARLAGLAASIEGDANYGYWAGKDIKEISDKLTVYLFTIRVNSVFL